MRLPRARKRGPRRSRPTPIRATLTPRIFFPPFPGNSRQPMGARRRGAPGKDRTAVRAAMATQGQPEYKEREVDRPGGRTGASARAPLASRSRSSTESVLIARIFRLRAFAGARDVASRAATRARSRGWTRDFPRRTTQGRAFNAQLSSSSFILPRRPDRPRAVASRRPLISHPPSPPRSPIPPSDSSRACTKSTASDGRRSRATSRAEPISSAWAGGGGTSTRR